MSSLTITKGLISYHDIPALFPDDKPIIFWDTCSLLYFNSIVDRRAYREFDWDKKLLDLIANGDVYSVTSTVVYHEFDSHHEALKIKDADRENALKNSMAEYGKIVGGLDEVALKRGMNALHLSAQMDSMVSELWRHTFVIDDDIDFYIKAHNRVLAKTPPASEKQEYKDCYIWETFLTLCDDIPHKGLAIFMTENTEDYCGKSKTSTPLPSIQSELNGHKGLITLTKCQLWVAVAKKLGLIP